MQDILKNRIREAISGKISFNEPLFRHTTFRIGGPIDFWVEPKDIDDLRQSLEFCKREGINLYIIGKGSNILVRDEGLRGMAVHLSQPFFKKIYIKGEFVRARGGVLLWDLINHCAQRGLSGLEFLAGIPGTVGGALAMNAGGAKDDNGIGDFVERVIVIDREGRQRIMRRGDINFSYRSSNLADYVIVEGAFRLKKSDKKIVTAGCRNFLKTKKISQVLDKPSCGSVFKNPDGVKFSAWELVDKAGLRGLKMGGAQVSDKHANFIVNEKAATFNDVSNLMNLIQREVLEKYNVKLEPEIKIL